jgi:hypothetical protein
MELSNREKRAIMLETQTPAYARTSEARRAIDDLYRQRSALNAVTGMKHSVRAIVPHNHKYVSGLNVPSNFEVVIDGPKNPLYRTRKQFEREQDRAKKALEKRNA